MKRLLIVVCALVAVALAATAVPATAQDGERPAGRLWDEFPLEPSPTPTPTASPTESRPTVVRPVEDDGMSRTALILLLAAAAGLGALTAYTAGRRRHVAGRQPAARDDETARFERALLASAARGLPRRSAPPSREAPAAPTPEASPDAPAPKPRRRVRASKPAPDAAEAAADATPAAESPAKPAPARKQRTRARAAKPAPDPAAPEPVADATQATDTPPAEPVEQPAPARKQRTRAHAAKPPPDPAAPEPASPEPVADAAPAAEPASPAPRPDAPRARRPAARSAGPFAEWDTCRIKLQSRSIKSYFFAVPFDGGPVIARSPYFKAARDGQGVGPAEALRALVAELTAAGWHQTGSGRAPWDLRFRRDVEAKRPLTPR